MVKFNLKFLSKDNETLTTNFFRIFKITEKFNLDVLNDGKN